MLTSQPLFQCRGQQIFLEMTQRGSSLGVISHTTSLSHILCFLACPFPPPSLPIFLTPWKHPGLRISTKSGCGLYFADCWFVWWLLWNISPSFSFFLAGLINSLFINYMSYVSYGSSVLILVDVTKMCKILSARLGLGFISSRSFWSRTWMHVQIQEFWGHKKCLWGYLHFWYLFWFSQKHWLLITLFSLVWGLTPWRRHHFLIWSVDGPE